MVISRCAIYFQFVLIASVLISSCDTKNHQIKERFKQDSFSPKEITLYSLLLKKHIILDKFKEQTSHVSFESIYDVNYLYYLKGQSNALVISHYPDYYEGSQQSLYLTELGSAVDSRLRQISAVEYNKFLSLLKTAPRNSPGKVLHLRLNLSKEKLEVFPLNHLFLILFQHYDDVDAKVETISKGLQDILKKTKAAKVDNLIIPCLTINWKFYDFSFEDFFSTVFQEILTRSSKPDVYLSLYSDWPSFFIEEAIFSLNAVWQGIAMWYGEKGDE
jgi:hypothetical protein